MVAPAIDRPSSSFTVGRDGISSVMTSKVSVSVVSADADSCVQHAARLLMLSDGFQHYYLGILDVYPVELAWHGKGMHDCTKYLAWLTILPSTSSPTCSLVVMRSFSCVLPSTGGVLKWITGREIRAFKEPGPSSWIRTVVCWNV